MIKAVLLGAGNLGYHLTHFMLKCPNIELIQVYNRSIEKIEYLKEKVAITSQLNELREANIYILCVSDQAISELSSQLHFPTKLVIHTSGATSINELKSDSQKGVIYFPQSFTKEKKISFKDIPICIEGCNENSLKILNSFSKKISKNIYLINSNQRKSLHLAAVFVNNFVNHLYYNAEQICYENNIPFDILKPIILETVKKVEDLSPYEAQTGPAKRQDFKTIEIHKSMLTSSKLKIYNLLTKSIQEIYGKKL